MLEDSFRRSRGRLEVAVVGEPRLVFRALGHEDGELAAGAAAGVATGARGGGVGTRRVAAPLRHAVKVVGDGGQAVTLAPGLDEGVAPPFALDEVVAVGEALGGSHLGRVWAKGVALCLHLCICARTACTPEQVNI